MTAKFAQSPTTSSWSRMRSGCLSTSLCRLLKAIILGGIYLPKDKTVKSWLQSFWMIFMKQSLLISQFPSTNWRVEAHTWRDCPGHNHFDYGIMSTLESMDWAISDSSLEVLYWIVDALGADLCKEKSLTTFLPWTAKPNFWIYRTTVFESESISL